MKRFIRSDKRRKIDDSSSDGHASEDLSEESYFDVMRMMLPELWEQVLSKVKLSTIAKLSLTSREWRFKAWRFATTVNFEDCVSKEGYPSPWTLTCVTNCLNTRQCSRIREIKLPMFRAPSTEPTSWEMEWILQLGKIPSVRVVDTYHEMSDIALEHMLVDKELVKCIGSPPSHSNISTSTGDSLDTDNLLAENSTAVTAPLPCQLRSCKFPNLEKITLRHSSVSLSTFKKICKSCRNLTDIEFVQCTSRKISVDHLKQLLALPKMNKFVPLYWACSFDYEALVKELLACYSDDIDVNMVHSGGQTPLTRACKKTHYEAAKVLIQSAKHIDVNAKTKDSITALHYAARDSDVEIVQALLDAGARVDEPKSDGCRPIHIAATHGHTEVVNLLMKHGSDINLPSKAGSTALHYAALNDKGDVVKLLLGANANVDAIYIGGWTALHLATRRNNMEVVSMLIDAGASVNISENHGWAPLHSAIFKGFGQMARLLATAGANIEARDFKHGRTPLHFAVVAGHGAIVEDLVKLGANINAKQAKGRTALHTAAINGRSDIVCSLLKLGANPHMQDRAGWTALQYASANNQVEIVRRLVQAEQATEPPSCGPCPPYTAAAESPPRDVDDSMQVDSIMPDIIPRHAPMTDGMNRSPNGSDPVQSKYMGRYDQGSQASLPEGQLPARPPGCCQCPQRDLRTPVFLAAQHAHVESITELLNSEHASEIYETCYGTTPLEIVVLKGQANHEIVADLIREKIGMTKREIAEEKVAAPSLKNSILTRLLGELDSSQPTCDPHKRGQHYWHCVTCNGPQSDAPGGVCTRCIVQCHGGHDIQYADLGLVACECACTADAEERRKRKYGKRRKMGGQGTPTKHLNGPSMFNGV